MAAAEPPRVAACFHGFLRTGAAMLPVRQRLLRAGYVSVRCPTMTYQFGAFDEHAEKAARLIKELSDAHGGAPVDIVSHSFGGLLTRGALRHEPPLRRVVMLAPPNQGAHLAEQVRRILPLHQLGWDPLEPLLPGVPERLPVPRPPVEVGVITGGTGDERGYSQLVPGDNDGKVRVEEAMVEGMRDFRVMPAGHTWVMATPSVLDQVVHFLDHGRFREAPREGELVPR